MMDQVDGDALDFDASGRYILTAGLSGCRLNPTLQLSALRTRMNNIE